jgi:hypothetical protein
MYIQNRRVSSEFKGCSPLQLHLDSIGLNPAIAYFAYTKRCAAYSGDLQNDKIIDNINKL